MQMSDAAVIYILLGLNALIVVALVVVFAISAVAHEKLFSMGQHEWCVGLPTMILWVGGGCIRGWELKCCDVTQHAHTHLPRPSTGGAPSSLRTPTLRASFFPSRKVHGLLAVWF